MSPSIKKSHSNDMDDKIWNGNERESSSEEEQSAENSFSTDDSSVEEVASVPQFPRRHRKRKYAELREVSENLKDLANILAQPPTYNKFDVFGQMIAMELKELRPDLAIECMKKISEHIYEIKLLNLRPPLADKNTEHSLQ